MRHKRNYWPKILLLLGFAFLFLILIYRQAIQDIWSFWLQKIKIDFDNTFYEASPEQRRTMPPTLAIKETELALYIGEPFKSFRRKDWNEFWNIVYGAFPKDEPQRQGLPRKIRQLTTEEIAYDLTTLYPDFFGYFDQEQWKALFGIILKK
jgi:hypothetical protein